MIRGVVAASLAGLLAARWSALDPLAIGIAAFVLAFLGLRLGRRGGGLLAALGAVFALVGVLAAIVDLQIPWPLCCQRSLLRAILLLDHAPLRATTMAISYAALLAGGISHVRGILAHELPFELRWRSARFMVESETPDHVTRAEQRATASSSRMLADAMPRPADSPASPHRTPAAPDTAR